MTNNINDCRGAIFHGDNTAIGSENFRQLNTEHTTSYIDALNQLQKQYANESGGFFTAEQADQMIEKAKKAAKADTLTKDKKSILDQISSGVAAAKPVADLMKMLMPFI